MFSSRQAQPCANHEIRNSYCFQGVSRKQIRILNAQMFKTVGAVSSAIENVRVPYRFLILNFCLPRERRSIFHWGHSILFRISTCPPLPETCPPLPCMRALQLPGDRGDGRRVLAHKLNAVSGVGRRIFVFAAYALKTVRIYFLPEKIRTLQLTD